MPIIEAVPLQTTTFYRSWRDAPVGRLLQMRADPGATDIAIGIRISAPVEDGALDGFVVLEGNTAGRLVTGGEDIDLPAADVTDLLVKCVHSVAPTPLAGKLPARGKLYTNPFHENVYIWATATAGMALWVCVLSRDGSLNPGTVVEHVDRSGMICLGDMTLRPHQPDAHPASQAALLHQRSFGVVRVEHDDRALGSR